MEPLFENDTVRTEAVDREFFRYVKVPKNFLVPGLLALALLGFIGYCLINAFSGATPMYYLALLFFVLLLCLAGVTWFQDSRLYKKERKEILRSFGTADLENHIVFYESEYHLTCKQTNVDVTVRYSDIAKITRTPSLFLLTRINHATTILARDGFSGRQEDDVLAFLLDVCAGAKYKDRCK